jgi:hypothetical protein
MTVTNGSFETAGAAPGLAASWTSTVQTSAEVWADFDGNPSEAFTRAQEGFEQGWTGSDDQALVAAFEGQGIDLETAVWSPGPGEISVEGFEKEWPGTPGGVHYGLITEITPEFVIIERFETGWFIPEDRLPATFEFVLAAPSDVVTDTLIDDFETGWGQDDIVNDLDPQDPELVQPAAFGAIVPEDFESFEDIQAPEIVTANPTTGVFSFQTAPGTPVILNDAVTLTNSDGYLPTPLRAGVTYYVTGVSGSTFHLKVSPAGAALDLSDAGAGVHYLVRDPAQWWTRILAV